MMNYEYKFLCLLLTVLLLSLSVSAQQTTRYVYDENGRLRAVIAPDGKAGVYDYDPAGNITAIRQLAKETLEIIDFAARQGVPGNQVRIYGVGFDGNVSAVQFNGVSANIIRQDANLVVVEVPANATTGPISLTATLGTVTTSVPFTLAGVIVLPITLSLLPGQVFQFSAQIPGLTNQAVKWFVNDTPGGSSQIGTISADGYYVAPNLAVSSLQVTVSAESVALPGLRGESQVTVRDTVYGAFSGAVTVQYKQDPATCAPTPPGLVAWYRAEGNAGDVTKNSHGALEGGATFAAGRVGQAFSLDGLNDYVGIPDHPSQTPASLTLEAWVNPTLLTSQQPILSKYNSSVAGGVSWILLHEASGKLRFVVYQSFSPLVYRAIDSVNTVLTPANWQHVAATFDLATQSLKMYHNGVAVAAVLDPGSATSLSGIFDSATPVRIGSYTAASSAGPSQIFWKGLIDEVSIFSRALSLSEIQTIYNIGHVGKCLPLENPPFAGQLDAVSVRYGTPTNTNSAYPTFANALSIRYGTPTSTNPFPAITSLSVTGSAVTSGIAPTIIRRGYAVSVTITGNHLTGVTSLGFFNEASGLDANITASNISVNAGGTSLTATINASANAAVGKRVVIVTAPTGRSQTSNTGVNTIEIQ